MSSLDMSRAEAILKSYYDDQYVTQLMYKDSPLFALLNKIEDFKGKDYPLPNRVSNPQGGSANFLAAKASKRPSQYSAFTLTRSKEYVLASIDTETMLAAESDTGAFLRAATAEIDGAFDTFKRRLGWAVYGDGSGSMGTLASFASDGSVATITFNDVENISKIEVGQTIEVRQTNGTLRTVTGPSVTGRMVVVGVNRDAGTATLLGTEGEAITAVSGTAATDTCNVYGDHNSKISGLGAWIPTAAPGATPFFGVNRSIDVTRLGGVRINCAGKAQDEAIVDAARRMGREGASPSILMTSYGKYSSLEKLLGSRVRYHDVEVAGIAWRAIEVSGPKGTIKVLADRDCPSNLQYMLTLDDWGVYSLGKAGRLLDQDGNRMLRESESDSVEVRVGGYLQVGCTNPGGSGVLIY